jgi:peroxiredoxin
MRQLVLSCLILSSSVALAADPPKDAPAGPTLGQMAAEKVGTAPAGFGIAVGQPAPDATLEDLKGKKQKLSDLYKSGPTFLIFYRGGWCPFCNLQLHELGSAKAEFDKRGVKLVAISVDKASEEAKTKAKHTLDFPLLSDSKLVAHKAFKVVHVTAAEEAKALAGYGIDLAAYSGQKHGSFAVSSVFMVDKAGVVRFAHVDEDYQTRPSAAQLLAVADKLAAK